MNFDHTRDMDLMRVYREAQWLSSCHNAPVRAEGDHWACTECGEVCYAIRARYSLDGEPVTREELIQYGASLDDREGK